MSIKGRCVFSCTLRNLAGGKAGACCVVVWNKAAHDSGPLPDDIPAFIPEFEAIALVRFNKAICLKWYPLAPPQAILGKDYRAEIAVWNVLPDGREELTESIYLPDLPKDEHEARGIFEAIQKLRESPQPRKAASKQSGEKRRHGEAAAEQQQAAVIRLLKQKYPLASLAQTAYDLVAVAPGLAPANWDGWKDFMRNPSLVTKLARHYERMAGGEKNPQKTQAQWLLARHWRRDGLFNFMDEELAAFIGRRMTPKRTLKPNTVAKYARELGLKRAKLTGPRPNA